MVLGPAITDEEYHSNTLVTVSVKSKAKLTSFVIPKAWENRALEFGSLVRFASFHFAFQLALRSCRITNSKVLARSISEITTPGHHAIKMELKTQQNRKAKKQHGKPCFSPPQAMLPPQVQTACTLLLV